MYDGPGDETAFEFQVDNNSNFSSPIVDRLVDPFYLAAPGSQSQNVNVWIDTAHVCDAFNGNDVPPITPIGCGDYLTYGTSYYWRVRVKNDCDWSEWFVAPSTYTFEWTHPGPTVAYTITPESPRINTSVAFADDNSSCWKSDLTSEACATISAYTPTYEWNFSVGSTPTATDNTRGSTVWTYDATGQKTTRLTICDDQSCCATTKMINLRGNVLVPQWKEISPF
jgi:hypothetical protein